MRTAYVSISCVPLVCRGMGQRELQRLYCRQLYTCLTPVVIHGVVCAFTRYWVLIFCLPYPSCQTPEFSEWILPWRHTRQLILHLSYFALILICGLGFNSNADASLRNGQWQEFHADWCEMILTIPRHSLKTLGKILEEVHMRFVTLNSFFEALKRTYVFQDQHKQTREDMTFFIPLRGPFKPRKFIECLRINLCTLKYKGSTCVPNSVLYPYCCLPVIYPAHITMQFS